MPRAPTGPGGDRKDMPMTLVTSYSARQGALALRGLAFGMALAVPGAVFAQDTTVETVQYDDGTFYEGELKDGVRHGTGTLRTPTGYEYTGTFVDGEIRGEGTARFPNGSVYEGAFVKGMPDGFGRITYPDGGSYEGDWAGGQMTGDGVATYPVEERPDGIYVAG